MWVWKKMEKRKRKVEERGRYSVDESYERTYHDDSAWLVCRAHAHDGSHTNGGALEIHPAEGEK